jgi:hypothetical protein
MPFAQSIESQIRDSIIALLRADDDVAGYFGTIVGGQVSTVQRGSEPWLELPQIVVRNVPQRDTLRRMIGGDLSRDSVFIAVYVYDFPEDETIIEGQITAIDRVQYVEMALERGTTGTPAEIGKLLVVEGDPADPLDWLTEKRPIIRRETPARITHRESGEAVADSYPLLLEYHVRRTTTTKTRF